MKLREIEISSAEAIERLDNIFLINSIFFLILGIIVLFSASNYDNYNEKSRRKIMASGVIIIVFSSCGATTILQVLTLKRISK